MLAHLVDAQTAAVDYVHGGEGLLMAPVYAMPVMLARNGLTPAGLRLLRDPRGVRLDRARDAEGLGGPGVLQGASSGLDAPLGSIDRSKLNVNGSSLAAGHPFAATGGRIVAPLAKTLHEAGPGKRGLISICAAGGQGVVAILES